MIIISSLKHSKLILLACRELLVCNQDTTTMNVSIMPVKVETWCLYNTVTRYIFIKVCLCKTDNVKVFSKSCQYSVFFLLQL